MRILLYISLIFCTFLGSYGVAEASVLPPDPQSEELILIPDICDGEDIIKANRMAGNIVRCVDEIVSKRADEMIRGMISDFSFVVFHVVIIAILVFFIRVMFGVARARGVISLFTLKVVLVLAVTNPDNSDFIIRWKDALLDFPQHISFKVLDAVKSPVTGTNIDAEDVFDALDQYVLQMFGVDESTLSDNREEQTEFYFGIAAMVAGLFFTGPVGAAISAVSVGFVIAVLTAVAQAVLFFCTIIVALNFFAAIAPIAVTCLLFQPTKKITTQWFQYSLIYIIQPIILMTVLGLTLGIIDGVIHNFNDPHEKILAKWNNEDGQEQKEITLFDCSKMSISAGQLLNLYGKNDFMGSVVAQGAMSDTSYDRYTMGRGSIGAESNFSADDLNINFGSNCEIKVPALRLDFNDPTLDDPNVSNELSEKSLRDFMGVELAMTILMIMLVSFLVKMPEMVDKMVGQGVIAELSRYSSSPVNTGKEMLYGSGDGKKKGIFQNAAEGAWSGRSSGTTSRRSTRI